MDLPNNSRYLHDSILMKILVKLPLKSVITCKLVCKSWYLLVSDSSFGEAYTSAESFKRCLYFGHKHLFLDEIGRKDVVRTSFNLGLHFPIRRDQELRMVGSCNGLCSFELGTRLSIDKFATTFYIYNPLTCEHIEIPERGCDHINRQIMSMGFGCSADTNEYKLVRFKRPIMQVFTMGVDSGWREFEDPCIPWSTSVDSSLLNGVLHWSGFDTYFLSTIIYAFNIEEERGRRIQLPLYLQDLTTHLSIGILNDHLCAVGVEDHARVWVMKDYGVVESWTHYILLRDPIPRIKLCWFECFVYELSSNLFALNQKDMDSTVFARDGDQKEHIIHGRANGYHHLSFVPCFSPLNDVIKGGDMGRAAKD